MRGTNDEVETGVRGTNDEESGVRGTNDEESGVRGTNDTGTGVRGTANTGTAHATADMESEPSGGIDTTATNVQKYTKAENQRA